MSFKRKDKVKVKKKSVHVFDCQWKMFYQKTFRRSMSHQKWEES